MGAENHGIVRLKCCVKNYDWGKVGKESSVAWLHAKNSGEAIKDEDPYAEFWMGSHDSGSSYVVVPVADGGSGDFVGLKEWIERNPAVLGDEVLRKWGPNLPFLFKVLSVAKALSIQAHPDKDLAALLHKQQPGVYKDDNHKPEMALAVTRFEALCGFVEIEEVKRVLHNVPEIVEVVGSGCADQVLHVSKQDDEKKSKGALQTLFTEVMSVNKSTISDVISKLISRLSRKREVAELTETEQLVLKLEKQYPGDIGVLAAFLLNYVKLNPGEALYLGANEPHAYIYGECIECMATSDNVVRAGLTPKHRDVQTLCSMLTYKQGSPEILSGVVSNPFTRKYIPPFDEFEVDQCILPQEKSTVFSAVPGPSIFVAMAGAGTFCTSSTEECITEGDVFFVPANTEITAASTSGMNLYRAGVNSQFFELSDFAASK
ncbi:mannose-6-phosphate isomerase 1-like [Dorcoceras hygrometricum]|uniref:mannose-6-phosphate isomerase n=1 Tax=Dorcoceras hygrometricum TaxID=472368 RepID=A0A2Z7BXF9_9LAMI|nr:mannose-6-phosphate isomerase 1-like [Dorcoceras hygrometricum]